VAGSEQPAGRVRGRQDQRDQPDGQGQPGGQEQLGGQGQPDGQGQPGGDLPEVEMWTDGACKGNPGIGGWGVLMRSGRHQRELHGGEMVTTNNQMELTAVIEGLRALNRRCRVRLHVDSVYVMKGMQEWIANWKRNGWRTAAKKPVKNADLWRALDEQVSRHEVTWVWVKGHSGDPGNERADELANLAIEELRAQHA